jgi:hypothetical protein
LTDEEPVERQALKIKEPELSGEKVTLPKRAKNNNPHKCGNPKCNKLVYGKRKYCDNDNLCKMQAYRLREAGERLARKMTENIFVADFDEIPEEPKTLY